MRRYWISFSGPDIPVGFRMGCGITASSRDDAFALLLKVWPAERDGPTISNIAEDVDLITLDQTHVLPNVGDATQRGVWFPNFG
jgi:hypothetical protein